MCWIISSLPRCWPARNLLDFEPVPATVLRVFCGIAILYSVFTDYELGLFELLSSRIHLRIDFVWGLLLAASPWLLGFGDEPVRVRAIHVAAGLLGMLVPMLSIPLRRSLTSPMQERLASHR